MRRLTIPLAVALVAALAVFAGWRFSLPPRTAVLAPGVRLDRLDVGGLAAPTAAVILGWLAPLCYRAPVDAAIDHATGVVRPAQNGFRLDQWQTMALLLAARPGQVVTPVLDTLKPRWPTEALRNLTVPLSSFQTTVTGDPNRVYNIELGASFLNNTLVLPGQVFSFNAAVGPYDATKGYREAPVIVNDRYESGPGGGVCQISSTLYQAVRSLGLTVVERHGHTLPVPYIGPDQDATVAGTLDFRFRNDLATPLLIKAACRGDVLTVSLLGRPDGSARTATSH